MSFSWFVARRYLTARRRQAFISLISAVSILGVGVGVMAVIIALALMTGVQGEMRDRLIGATAHMYVSKPLARFDDLDVERRKMLLPGVVGAAPTVMGEALLDAPAAKPAIRLKGIDPAYEPEVTDLATAMTSGSLDALANRGPDDFDGIILGDDLARSVGVRVGDLVRVQTLNLTSTPMGLVPRTRPMEVVGTFRFGFHEVDKAFGLLLLPVAEQLLGRDGPDLIQLRLADADRAPAFKPELEAALGDEYDVQDWTDLNGSLYAALRLEKVAISLAIGLIVMVAALNLVASLVLLVMEKTRDIAILRTMGAPARTIRRIFILQGLAIGLVGTFGGAVMGVVACRIADRYKLISMPADVYQISHLPFRVQPLDVTVVVAAAILICLVATIYPSRQAGRIDPAEALRNQ
ncbi:MAG: ABC transporter permease [Planctomycetes bacterium]|nr:ABC transporter permease [Planctomycetota bacterium]